MTHYNKAISWCRIFLLGNSFTAFSGSEVALALLFPMEKVFENFIAAKLRKSLHNDFKMKTQDTTYYLFDCPNPAFSLRPDIVLEKNKEYTVILDTKWKILSDQLPNKGISQYDMYQMYVYCKKYNADKIILVYPLADTVRNTDIVYTSNDKVKIEVFFVDLRNVNGSIARLANNLN
jgi:5-methylcytosine-specific restriction enzyme subunit McrC